MPTVKAYAVWEWIDPTTAEPVYVGCSKNDAGIHPADAIWNVRHTYESTLTRWLRTLPAKPRRIDLAGAEYAYRQEAESIYAVRKSQLRREKVQLLSSRDLATYAGGGKSRAVLSPEWEVFPSVREAAIATGVQPATITRKCQSAKTGWKYFDEVTSPGGTQ